MKKTLAILLVLAMAFSLLAGCGSKGGESAPVSGDSAPESENSGYVSPSDVQPRPDGKAQPSSDNGTTEKDTDTEPAQPETRVIVDEAGNEVEIPKEINRVAITSVTPLPALFALFMGSAEKLVGIHPASKNTAMHSIVAELVPDIADVPTSFYEGSEINAEELIKLEPDVVFYFAGKEQEKELIEKAGIPAVAFDPFYDGNTGGDGNSIVKVTLEWTKFLSEIFDMPDRSAQFESFKNEIETLVAERIADVPEAERPRSLIIANYNDSALVAGGTQSADYWIRYSGGINVGFELGNSTAPVNMEQIYEWDPDIIFLNSFSAFKADDILNSTAAEGHDWSGLRAVQEGRVYKIPLGTFYWFATTYDSPLMMLWMAMKQLPDQFADIDFDQMVRDHYKNTYGIDLTDEQLARIYDPVPESHM